MKFFPPFTLEVTFAMIKPHIIRVPLLTHTIKEEILRKNFFIIRSQHCVMNQYHIRKLYEEHEGKPFYNRLTSFMTSGAIECYLLARENGIKVWRDLMGPTKVLMSQYTHPNCLRGRFGLSDTRNATHGADCAESVVREASVFFPDFSIEDWYEEEEVYFRNGFVSFDEENFIHTKNNDCHSQLLLEKKN